MNSEQSQSDKKDRYTVYDQNVSDAILPIARATYDDIKKALADHGEDLGFSSILLMLAHRAATIATNAALGYPLDRMDTDSPTAEIAQRAAPMVAATKCPKPGYHCTFPECGCAVEECIECAIAGRTSCPEHGSSVSAEPTPAPRFTSPFCRACDGVEGAAHEGAHTLSSSEPTPEPDREPEDEAPEGPADPLPGEGFYEKLWKDFVSLQRGDMQGICAKVEKYYREQASASHEQRPVWLDPDQWNLICPKCGASPEGPCGRPTSCPTGLAKRSAIRRPECPYCTSDNEAIRSTYYDQTCEGCVKRMGQP